MPTHFGKGCIMDNETKSKLPGTNAVIVAVAIVFAFAYLTKVNAQEPPPSPPKVHVTLLSLGKDVLDLIY